MINATNINTPSDITPAVIREEVAFTTTRFKPGFEVAEVRAFLDHVASKIEDLMRERDALARRNRDLESRALPEIGR